ncbi:MAG: hypothetical protein V3W41_14535 [Planctomycetota bacterium]
MTAATRVDPFGRLILIRSDREILSAVWVAENGLPRRDADLIARDQWVAKTALALIRDRR